MKELDYTENSRNILKSKKSELNTEHSEKFNTLFFELSKIQQQTICKKISALEKELNIIHNDLALFLQQKNTH